MSYCSKTAWKSCCFGTDHFYFLFYWYGSLFQYQAYDGNLSLCCSCWQ